MDFMNKSDADYGRTDTVEEAVATKQKYFENEQNP